MFSGGEKDGGRSISIARPDSHAAAVVAATQPESSRWSGRRRTVIEITSGSAKKSIWGSWLSTQPTSMLQPVTFLPAEIFLRATHKFLGLLIHTLPMSSSFTKLHSINTSYQCGTYRAHGWSVAGSTEAQTKLLSNVYIFSSKRTPRCRFRASPNVDPPALGTWTK